MSIIMHYPSNYWGNPILTYTRLSPVCLRLSPSTVLMCSLFSMTNTSARPPRFPSVLYDLGRLVCTNQMSCRCSGPLGRVASHLPTPCFADPADSRPACLSPISLPAVSHLQVLSGCFGPHGSALASHMSTNVSQYAVDALTLAPHLSPPASARVLWAFWAAPFYTYVPLVSHLPPTVSEYAVGALHFSRTVSTDTLDVLCRMNLHLSPPCLLLSLNKSWVLWAAGSYTCFPLVFYCLTVRCSVGALGYFLFSFVSCLSPCMPCCAISEAVYSRVRWCVIGVVGAAFQLFPRVSHLLHKSVPVILFFGTADFTLLLLGLPLVYRFFSCLRRNWDRISVSPTCLSFVVCFCLCVVLTVKNMICLPPNPTFLPLPSLCCGLWSPVCLPISLIISFLTCIWSHGRHQFGAWCFLLLFGLGWNGWFRAAFVLACLPCFVSYFWFMPFHL